MDKITEITRSDIYELLRNGVDEFTDKFEFFGRLNVIDFLGRLYDLESLPSKDRRFKNALYDIRCHDGFGDYDDDYWFLDDDRFLLRNGDGDEPLLNFLCEIFHPAVRKENSNWVTYFNKIDELLKKDGYEFYEKGKISGRDIYGIQDYEVDDYEFNVGDIFTERYHNDVFDSDNNVKNDYSSVVNEKLVGKLVEIIFEFNEPTIIQHSRYSDFKTHSNVMNEVSKTFHEFEEEHDYPKIENGLKFVPYLFDLIELQFNLLSYYEKYDFKDEINALLSTTDFFELSDRGLIIKKEKYNIINDEMKEKIDEVKEPGLKDLLKEAIEKYSEDSNASKKDAVEKIWDVLERLKTYYGGKKRSAEKIVNDISGNTEFFIELFNKEFTELTRIGNETNIRHFETYKQEITDQRYYDYLFNRCLSLIVLSLDYLE